jgi:hypothetical protein
MCFVWKTSDLFRQINDFHVLNETIHNVLSDMILLTSYVLINPCNLITLSKFNFFVVNESKVIYILFLIRIDRGSEESSDLPTTKIMF